MKTALEFWREKNGELRSPELPPEDIGGRTVLSVHDLLEPTGERLFRRTPQRDVRALCLALAVLFLADCILSLLFRTPITY